MSCGKDASELTLREFLTILIIEKFCLAVRYAELLTRCNGCERMRGESARSSPDSLRNCHVGEAAVIEHAEPREDPEPQELALALAAISPDAK